jgi:hypothetical protein
MRLGHVCERSHPVRPRWGCVIRDRRVIPDRRMSVRRAANGADASGQRSPGPGQMCCSESDRLA